MKISSKLEEMVADLISDAQRERDEVEDLLAQIADLVERFKETRDQPDPRLALTREPEQDFEPAPVLPEAERIKNFKAFRERMGDPPARAEEVALEMVRDQ